MKPHLGTFLSIGSPIIAELAALSGFDWVLIDLEHGNASETFLQDQLRALRGSKTHGIVRVGGPQADLIARVLDWGAHGIMVPHVCSAGAAEAIVQAAHYAPRGRRGYSRTVRAHEFGLRPAEQTPAPIIMAQIESMDGVKHAAEIARVDGIDVLFVGPADLQHDLTHRAAEAPGDFSECLRIVVEAAIGEEKQAGILTRDLAGVRQYLEQGFTHLAIDSDLSLLRNAYRQVLSSVKQEPLLG